MTSLIRAIANYLHRVATYDMTVVAVDLKADPYAATIVSASFGGQPTLTFDMYGGVSSGGSVVVQAGGTQKTITVDANTGKASAP